MNGRGLAIVFAEDEPTITDSYQPGKDHSFPHPSPFIFGKFSELRSIIL
jgi:hypothetical protein